MLSVEKGSCEYHFNNVIGLIRLGIKPESAATEADALNTWPSELKKELMLTRIVLAF